MELDCIEVKPLYVNWDALAAEPDPVVRAQVIAGDESVAPENILRYCSEESCLPTIPIPLGDLIAASEIYEGFTVRYPNLELVEEKLKLPVISYFAADQQVTPVLTEDVLTQFPETFDIGSYVPLSDLEDYEDGTYVIVSHPNESTGPITKKEFPTRFAKATGCISLMSTRVIRP
jgi:hypothetical protein